MNEAASLEQIGNLIKKSLGKIPGINNVVGLLKGKLEDVVKKLYQGAGQLNPQQFKNAKKIADLILKGQEVSESVVYVEGVLSGMRDIKKIVMAAVLMSVLAGIGNNAFARSGRNASPDDLKTSIEHVLEGDPAGESGEDGERSAEGTAKSIQLARELATQRYMDKYGEQPDTFEHSFENGQHTFTAK